MKRFILLFVAVMALFVAIPKEAYASSYQPNYTVVENYKDVSRMNYIYAQWGQSGYTLSNYPHRVLIDCYYDSLRKTVGIMSSKPIVFNPNTLQFESEGGMKISEYVDASLASIRDLSIFVLLDEYTNVKLYSTQTVMMKGEDRSFFPLPPVPTPKPTLGEIVQTGTSQQSPMSQVISLLPLLIFLVASLLGLRKCLQMLRNLLTKA